MTHTLIVECVYALQLYIVVIIRSSIIKDAESVQKHCLTYVALAVFTSDMLTHGMSVMV